MHFYHTAQACFCVFVRVIDATKCFSCCLELNFSIKSTRRSVGKTGFTFLPAAATDDSRLQCRERNLCISSLNYSIWIYSCWEFLCHKKVSECHERSRKVKAVHADSMHTLKGFVNGNIRDHGYAYHLWHRCHVQVHLRAKK